MIRALTIAFIGLALFSLAGCSSMSVNHDWDDQFDFDKVLRFTVVDADGIADPLVAGRVKNAIVVHLTERGFVEDDANPDFFAAAHANVVDRVDVHSWGYSSSSRHWHSGRDITVRQYQEGTMIIDLVDSVDKELFWRGWGTTAVGSSTRGASSIQNAVDNILDQFPPK